MEVTLVVQLPVPDMRLEAKWEAREDFIGILRGWGPDRELG